MEQIQEYNNNTVIKNISFDQSEILLNIMKLYNDGQPFECDITASELKFYQKNKQNKYDIPIPKILMDVYPQREDIIKITTNISLDYKSDIKAYMNEFGFTTFEVLIIKKQKKYIGNLIVITLGIVELCIGTALLAYSANPMIFQIARAFIREGIKDLIK